MANYIGKIAAVGTINMSQIASGLNASARDVEKYARSVRSTITSANTAAGRSFQEIFTPLQRLERALQASQNRTLRVDVGGGAERIRAIVGAAEDIARPLAASQKQFSTLAATVQNEFIGSLVRAQNAAKLAENAINRGQITNAAGYERLKRIVDSVTESQRRLSEASAATSGLATGRELRFQQADFASELQRTSALQSQASALPADARRSGAVGQLVELQRREAEEAARLLSVLENVRNTRRGDAAAAQANLDAQVQRVSQINSQLERQIALYREAEQRQRQVAVAAEQVAASRSATELNRRDGVLARRNAERFAQSTAGLVGDSEAARRQRELERSERIRADFGALPASAQGALEQQKRAFENTASAARANAAAVGTLADANDRLAASIESAQEAAADQQRRRDAATASLPPVIPQPGDEIRGRLGPDIASAAAEFSRLEAATVSVRSQIENLPAPIRAQFIPALRDAVEELVRLQTTNAGADEIARATQRVNELRAGVTRADRAFQAFGGNFRDFADGADFQGAAGRLNFLRQTLLRATGDTQAAEAALDRLADAFRDAASTPGGFRQLSAQLNQIQEDAVSAVAATEGVGQSPERLAEGLRRAGDVSRGSFGNVQLAVQQAAFAVDDFFSVTGDLSQRIRAAGNNISQLAFILGGTQGLIIGVAASIGAQLVVAINRWINAGVEAQDSTKALNQALSDQIRLVDELAESFSRLGRSITLDAFSGGARSAEEFRREIEQLRRQQEDARRQRAGLFDPEAQRQRGIQARSDRELQNATEIGDIVALQREIEQARARERVATDEAFRRPPVAPRDAIDAVVQSITAISEAAAADAANLAAAEAAAAGGDAGQVEAARRRELEAGRRRADEFRRRNAGLNTAAEAESAVQQEIDRLTLRRRQTGFTSVSEARAIDAELQRLQQILVGLQGATIQELDDATIQVIESLRATASGIQLAQEDLQNAIRQGIPGALLLGEELKAAANSLTAAQRDFQQASSEVRNALALPSATEQERADRDAAITAARQREQEAARRVEAERVRSRRLEDRAFGARQRLALDPQATIDARLARASSNLGAAGAESGALARRAREIEFQRAEIERARQSPEFVNDPLSQRLFQQSIDALSAQSRELEVASLRVREFGQSLSQAQQRIASGVDQAVNSLEQARDLDAGFSTQFSRDQVRRAREDLDERRRNQSAANAAIDARRAELEQGSPFDAEFRRLREINERLLSGAASVEEQRVLLDERRRIEQTVAPERQRIDDEVNRDPTVVNARRAAQRQELEARGFDLARTPAQRAGEQLARDLEALRLAFARQAAETTGIVDQAGLRQAQNRVFGDAVRQQAPLVAQFSDEVFNALLQGPSRASLQAADASTVEGRRELDRLLRGDDPARDVNLLELQRQTERLTELVQIARDGPGVAN